MSKSKGEFLTVSLLEEKGYAPVVYRFFCLQSHYRKSLVFSWENLDNAAVAYAKLIAKIAALPEEDGAVDMAAAETLQQKFRTAMDNDLNTSMGVTVLYDVLKAKTNGATKRYVLTDFDRVLSLDLLENAARKKGRAEADRSGLRRVPDRQRERRDGRSGGGSAAGPLRRQEGQGLHRGGPHPGRSEGHGRGDHGHPRWCALEEITLS